MGIVDRESSKPADLEMKTKQEDVLAVIERFQSIELCQRQPL